jgi:type IV secretory pathway VirD2 relaxase
MSFVSHSYSKSAEDAGKHIDYIAFRDREDESENKGLFSAREDNADIQKFKESLHDKRTDHSQVATAHKLLFSMSGDEWNRSGFQPGDYQKIIRNVMNEWELKTGYRLNWVAAEHRNPDHPHVHVVLKATYTDRDGVEHRLKVTNEDRQFFRKEFTRQKDLERGFELPERERSFGKEPSMEKPINMDLLNSLIYEINARLREEEYEREREQSRSR